MMRWMSLLSLAPQLLHSTLRTHSHRAAHPNKRGVAAVAGLRLDYAIRKLHDSPDANAGPSHVAL